MDLTRESPRSPSSKLCGLVWCARMVDKARARQAGTLGDFESPCPMDQRFLSTLGVAYDEISGQIRAGKSDDEIAGWLDQRLKMSDAQKAAFNESFLGKAA